MLAGTAGRTTPARADGGALTIVAAEGGRPIFEPLISELQARDGLMPAPQVTYSNSAAALSAFCSPNGQPVPDMLLTLRRVPAPFVNDCTNSDPRSIAQVELGRGALVLAVRAGSALTALTANQVYLALARDVPFHDEFRRNTAVRWSDIDRSLPPQDIRFLIPPRGDAMRRVFDDLVLEGGCRQEPMVRAIASAQYRTGRCVTIRFDRVREIPRDQALRSLLEAPEGTVGVLTSFDLLDAGALLTGLAFDGVQPTPAAIGDASYDLSGSLWLYARRGQPGGDPLTALTISHAIDWAASDAVIGPGGVLAQFGLVPLSAEERIDQRQALYDATQPFGIHSLVGMAGSTISSFWSMFGITFGEINPPSAADSVDLTALMEIAGFKVKQLDTDFGLIPGASMTFGLAREMSPADREYLERMLDRDSRRRTGMLSAIQRRIVRTIIDMSARKGYDVSSVEIDLLPLPSVKLVVTPSGGGLSAETTTIIRAIERTQDRTAEGAR